MKKYLTILFCFSILFFVNTDSFSTESPFITEEFSGEVKEGVGFEKKITDNLTFYLKPLKKSNGWYITITDALYPIEDYSIVTLPLRSANPKHITLEHTHKDKKPSFGKSRDLNFILNRSDYKKVFRSARILLWNSGYSKEEIKEAEDILFDQSKQARAIFTIMDLKVTKDKATNTQTIDSIKFRVELFPPQVSDSVVRAD